MITPTRTIIDKQNGRKWEIFKKSANEYYIKYYEYFTSCDWRYMWQDGDHIEGYYDRETIQDKFNIMIV
jgi:hypothetical protein